jgi:hypothetical protein
MASSANMIESFENRSLGSVPATGKAEVAILLSKTPSQSLKVGICYDRVLNSYV